MFAGKVTVLEKSEDYWTEEEQEVLMGALNTLANCHQIFPHILILMGAHTKEQVAEVLRYDIFTHRVVTGSNSSLPFMVRF